jgi:hypothetical protein
MTADDNFLKKEKHNDKTLKAYNLVALGLMAKAPLLVAVEGRTILWILVCVEGVGGVGGWWVEF